MKQILNYSLWIVLSIAIGITYMRILISPNFRSAEGLDYILKVFFDFGPLYIGVPLGILIALSFIIMDYQIIRPQSLTCSFKLIKRLHLITVIALIVFALHYFAEKVIDNI
ncbi:hypothetical protein [Winogradskyella sp. J14-2]|uniref:hypothetical protein n=1 Tax=Winogradskyella sp. J14-2 TaxID=1936080 RepID=UPI0012FC4AB7|nr:hypothetical protein [Winogradskyella sp. J14-2]